MSQVIYSMLLLVAFNLANVHIDAFKILYLNRGIKHSMNFIAYAGACLLCILLTGYHGVGIVVFGLNAFTGRQLFFDIPLNWRRGLSWDYVTTAEFPGSVLDRLEIHVFGRNGRLPVLIYSLLFLISTIILLSL